MGKTITNKGREGGEGIRKQFFFISFLSVFVVGDRDFQVFGFRADVLTWMEVEGGAET